TGPRSPVLARPVSTRRIVLPPPIPPAARAAKRIRRRDTSYLLRVSWKPISCGEIVPARQRLVSLYTFFAQSELGNCIGRLRGSAGHVVGGALPQSSEYDAEHASVAGAA